MYIEQLPEILGTTAIVKIVYDCCDKPHELKWKDANKNYQKNGGKHICRQCSLKTNNPASRPEVREKMKATCMEKYGATCAMNTEAKIAERVKSMFGSEDRVQEIVAKRKKTSLEKYGTESPMQNAEVKAKQHAIMVKKYGVDVPLKNPDILAKMRKTVEDRYGVGNVAEVPEIRLKGTQTMVERYGVEHYNQLPEMRDYLRNHCREWLKKSWDNPWAKGTTRPQQWNEKQSESMSGKIVDGEYYGGGLIRGHYKGKKSRKATPFFRSRLELFVLHHLENDDNVEWYDVEPFSATYTGQDGKNHRYIPDFAVKSINSDQLLILEVKPAFRLLEEATKIKIAAGKQNAEVAGMLFEHWDEKKIFGWGYDLDDIIATETLHS